MGNMTPLHTKLYYLYAYNSPVGVMSPAEAIIFNSMVISSLLFSIYWMFNVFPLWAVRILETTYYYLTGKTISAVLLASIYFSRKMIWSSQVTVNLPHATPNITRIGRERLGF